MINLPVPAAVKNHPQIAAGDISFVWYSEKNNLGKTYVIFNHAAISFVLNGVKEIYLSAGREVVTPGVGMFIPAGNSIIAERSNNHEPYSSLIVFFPTQLAVDFLNKKPTTDGPAATINPDYILFKRDNYLHQYVKTIQELILQQQQISYTIAKHKLEELLLVLYELYPAELTALFAVNINEQQLSLKKVVENNLLNNLSLAELAFLANRSLSSFKRDFEKAYGVAPQTYIREKKLEAACHELGRGKKAAELYLPYGYENLSNFNTAFKKKFGVTPSQFNKTAI